MESLLTCEQIIASVKRSKCVCVRAKVRDVWTMWFGTNHFDMAICFQFFMAYFRIVKRATSSLRFEICLYTSCFLCVCVIQCTNFCAIFDAGANIYFHHERAHFANDSSLNEKSKQKWIASARFLSLLQRLFRTRNICSFRAFASTDEKKRKESNEEKEDDERQSEVKKNIISCSNHLLGTFKLAL